ncbi:hypothetical protein HDU76_011695, partial [Blyttiomyces sp. JEL0837]
MHKSGTNRALYLLQSVSYEQSRYEWIDAKDYNEIKPVLRRFLRLKIQREFNGLAEERRNIIQSDFFIAGGKAWGNLQG